MRGFPSGTPPFTPAVRLISFRMGCLLTRQESLRSAPERTTDDQRPIYAITSAAIFSVTKASITSPTLMSL
jgi:hypothetical protein